MALAGLLTVLALGTWYLWPLWNTPPMTVDANTWIEKGAGTGEPWRRWVFETQQFGVGYRPVAALSYTLDHRIAGFAPWIFRLTNLLAFVACAALLFALARQIFRGSLAWPLVATGLFLAHPVVEEVAPFIARRGYTIALGACLGAWWLLGRSACSTGLGRRAAASAAAGVLLALGALANEVSLVYAVAAPALVLAQAPAESRWRRAVLAGIGPALFVGLAWWLRGRVVEGLGGYTIEEGEGRGRDTLYAAWNSLAASGTWPTSLFWLPLAGLAGTVGVAALRLRETRSVLLVTALALQMGAIFATYATLGVWFERMAFFLLPPFCLILATVGRAACSASGLRRALPLAPLGLLAGGILAASPVLNGPARERTQKWRADSALIRSLEDALEHAQRPARILLVVPMHAARGGETSPEPEQTGKPGQRPDGKPGAKAGEGRLKRKVRDQGLSRGTTQPVDWVRLVHAAEDLELVDFVYFELDPRQPRYPEADAGGVRLPEGVPYLRCSSMGKFPIDARGPRLVEPEVERRRPKAETDGVPTFLYVHGASGGELHRLAR